MRTIFAIWLVCAVSGCLGARSIKGPCSWTQVTPDGRSIFVMRVDTPNDRYKSKQQISFESKYAKSGLYPLGGSVPYWTVTWYAHQWNVVLSHTGEFAAVHGAWYQTQFAALSFLARGKLMKAWEPAEVDPVQAKWVAQQQSPHETTRGNNWRYFYLRMYEAEVSKDGYLELPTQSGTIAFSMATGEMLRKPQPAKPVQYKCPEDPLEYEAFCRALGTSGTRNPNFVSGLPEFEFDIVQPRPIQRPKVNTLRVPRDTYSFISPPLRTDPTDWHLYIAVGTAFSYALCFCVIRVSKSRSQAAT